MHLFDSLYSLGDNWIITQKNWVDLGEFDRLDLAWPKSIGRGWKPPKALNNTISHVL
jgi:hypothetical protein